MESRKQENGILVNIIQNLVLRGHLMGFLYSIDIINVLKTCKQFKDLIESWAPNSPETSLFTKVHTNLGISDTNLNRYLFNKQFRYLQECERFKEIVWLNGQYLKWNTSKTDSAFGKYVHLDHVWWMLFDSEFIDIPVQHYKVYWRIRRTRNFQIITDVIINREASSLQSLIIDQKKSKDWELVYGGYVTPPTDKSNTSTTMTVRCVLKNIDNSYKTGLDVDYVQLIPVSSIDDAPYILMLRPSFQLKGEKGTNQEKEEEVEEEEELDYDEEEYDDEEMEDYYNSSEEDNDDY